RKWWKLSMNSSYGDRLRTGSPSRRSSRRALPVRPPRRARSSRPEGRANRSASASKGSAVCQIRRAVGVMVVKTRRRRAPPARAGGEGVHVDQVVPRPDRQAAPGLLLGPEAGEVDPPGARVRGQELGGELDRAARVVAEDAPERLVVARLLLDEARDPVGLRPVRDVLVVSRPHLALAQQEGAVGLWQLDGRPREEEDVALFQHAAMGQVLLRGRDLRRRGAARRARRSAPARY